MKYFVIASMVAQPEDFPESQGDGEPRSEIVEAADECGIQFDTATEVADTHTEHACNDQEIGKNSQIWETLVQPL